MLLKEASLGGSSADHPGPFGASPLPQEITLTEDSSGIGLHETPEGDLFLFVGYKDTFHMIEVGTRQTCKGGERRARAVEGG